MSEENPTEEEIWWKGRHRPILTRAEFDALSDADLTLFMAQNVCRFYRIGNACPNDIWWEGAEGWPTEFLIDSADREGRTTFLPLLGCTPSIKRLEAMCGVKYSHPSPREFCWSCLRAAGFTPGIRFAGEICFVDPKPKWPHT